MPEPTEEAVRMRAYELWEKAGRPDGGHEEHWLEAERSCEWRKDSSPTVLSRMTRLKRIRRRMGDAERS